MHRRRALGVDLEPEIPMRATCFDIRRMRWLRLRIRTLPFDDHRVPARLSRAAERRAAKNLSRDRPPT